MKKNIIALILICLFYLLALNVENVSSEKSLGVDFSLENSYDRKLIFIINDVDFIFAYGEVEITYLNNPSIRIYQKFSPNEYFFDTHRVEFSPFLFRNSLSNLIFRFYDFKNNLIYEERIEKFTFIDPKIEDFSYNYDELLEAKNLLIDQNMADYSFHLIKFDMVEKLVLNNEGDFDLTYIGEMNNIKKISIKNKITDISSLKNLSELAYLDLFLFSGDEEIQHVSKLKNLKQLRLSAFSFIYQTDVHVNDFSPLSKLSNLEEFEIYLVPGDYSTFDELSNLERLSSLKIWSSNQDNFHFISNFTKLKKLKIHNLSAIMEIDSLFNFTELEELSLSGIKISNTGSISNLKNLRILNLSLNYMQNEVPLLLDISFIEDLYELYYLEIKNIEIKNFPNFINNQKLVSLNMIDCNLDNIENLAHLSKLEILDISENNIRNVNFLVNLPQLKKLNIDKNPIEDYSIFIENNFPYLDLEEIIP